MVFTMKAAEVETLLLMCTRGFELPTYLRVGPPIDLGTDPVFACLWFESFASR